MSILVVYKVVTSLSIRCGITHTFIIYKVLSSHSEPRELLRAMSELEKWKGQVPGVERDMCKQRVGDITSERLSFLHLFGITQDSVTWRVARSRSHLSGDVIDQR